MSPIGEPGENPVTPEQIAGIPSPAQKDEEEGRIKSPDRKIPPEVQESFSEIYAPILNRGMENIAKVEKVGAVLEEDKLFFANSFIRTDPEGKEQNYTYRAYHRYQLHPERERREGQFLFSIQNEVRFFPNSLTLFKADVSPTAFRTREDSGSPSLHGVLLQISSSGEIRFDQVLDDRSMKVKYASDGKLDFVAFNEVFGQESLLGDLDEQSFEEATEPQAEKYGSLIMFGRDGSLSLHSLYTGGFRDVVGFEEVIIEGSKAQIVDAEEGVKIIFYRKEDPNVVDYEITVPKKQEREDFWTGDIGQTEPERRYVWEKELIPEALRADPLNAPTDLDDAWKRADLARTIGIKIEKNLAA